jgi:hypothetical protein
MTYGEKIKDIGPISFQLDDGNTHPSGFPLEGKEGVLFNVVAAVVVPQARKGQSLDAATAAYDKERRESLVMLDKVETYLKSLGYSFSHKHGCECKGEKENHVNIDDQVAWLQVAKFPELDERNNRAELEKILTHDVRNALTIIERRARNKEQRVR